MRFEYHPAGTRFDGRDAMVAQLRTIAGRAPGYARAAGCRADVPAPGVFRRRETWQGEDARGGAWETVVETVFVLDEEDRMVAVESFLPGDPRIDDAVARLARAATSRA